MAYRKSGDISDGVPRIGRLTPDDEKLILDSYNKGCSYKDINKKYGFSSNAISRVVKGTRSLSESIKLARARGKGKLTEEGRQALSDSGKRSCQRCGKVYTKPERAFKDILNSAGIGVQFPSELKKVLGVEDDKLDEYKKFICFQYPLQRYVLDFADVDSMVAINVNGDFWHANPVLYNSNELGAIQKHNVRTDENKRVFLEKHGWTVIDIWESEITWNVGLVIDKLRAAGITGAHLDYTQEDRVQFPSRLPDWSDRLSELWDKRYRSGKGTKKKDQVTYQSTTCLYCGKEFSYRSGRVRKYCSSKCSLDSKITLKATPEELLYKLNELGSYTRVGEYFGVSNNAVKKRCKKLGIYNEASIIVRSNIVTRARHTGPFSNPDTRKTARIKSATSRSQAIPYYVAVDPITGTEMYRFATNSELKAAGFSVSVVLRACAGKVKTYRGMRWHRESKLKQ